MKNPTTRTLLIAATLLVPASAAFAVDDAFSGYQRGILGMTATPASGAAAVAATVCGRDPFDGYRRGIGAGGPAQVCGDMAAGAQGPAGPTMTAAWRDPFEGYKRGIGSE